jgi:hypothetical protein
VVVAVEANAWPRDDARGALPHELVHVIAQRLDGSERFEALVRPEGVLSETTPHHARLPREAILEAPGPEAFREAWRAFARPDDVLCGWGGYARDVLARRGATLPTAFLDLRAAVAAHASARPGSADAACSRWGLTPAPLGRGRAGERLGVACALASALAQSSS